MKILWVATKAPWPPIDGGRLLLANTLAALRDRGHDLTLVAPADPADCRRIEEALRPLCRPLLAPARPRAFLGDALRAQLRCAPLTIVRHALPAMRRRMAELLDWEAFEVVQAEQVQALSSVDTALSGPAQVVLRAQNVESDLWRQTAQDELWRRPALTLEARRLAAWEGRAVRRCDATLALTAEDADRLAAISGAAAKVHTVPAPFEAELPAAEQSLPGSPPVVLFGSGGWRPNAAGAAWFLRRVWPRVRESLPEAVLHVFGLGAQAPGVVPHPSPEDSRTAYPAGAVLVVPLRVASGVRIKILEAWARGLPVVATPEAARGLDARDGEHLLIARDGEGFTNALGKLADSPELAASLVDSGRRRLRERHALPLVAERLEEIYAALAR